MYTVLIDVTHATRKRELDTRIQKNNRPSSSARAAIHRSTTAGLPEALLVSHNEASYPRSTYQAYHSSADPSDPSMYGRFCLDHPSGPHCHAPGECPHVARSDAARLEAIKEANYPAYHDSLKERHRTRRRTTGTRRVANLCTKTTHTSTISSQKNKRSATRRKPCTSLFSYSAAVR